VLISVLAVLSLMTTRAAAQGHDDPQHDTQLWPDTQVAFKLRPDLRLILYGTARIGHVDTTLVSARIGVGLNKSFGEHFSGALFYHRINSESATRLTSREHRIFIELTPRTALGQGFAVQNRVRLEWREINNRGSWRFRNRLQFERPFNLGARKLTPYLAGETYYDTRFRTWNRNDLFLGARVPLNQHVTIDGFYMRRWDARARPGFLHVIGAYWRLEF
jgi:hypothetical protein